MIVIYAMFSLCVMIFFVMVFFVMIFFVCDIGDVQGWTFVAKKIDHCSQLCSSVHLLDENVNHDLHVVTRFI